MTTPFPPPLRILVVDDEESVRTALTELLQFCGHVVDTASGALEALGLFQEGKFELVITDYSMSGMNGADLAVALNADRGHCPVILVTAYAHALPPTLPSVDAIVSKPFSSQELRDTIAKVMEARMPGSVPSASVRSCPSV